MSVDYRDKAANDFLSMSPSDETVMSSSSTSSSTSTLVSSTPVIKKRITPPEWHHQSNDQAELGPSIIPNNDNNTTTALFASPPAMTHHMDYQSKAEIRRKELEALRQQKLAKPKAALLQETTGNPHFENMADFEEKRRSYHKQQRESQKTALELLHHYRADDQVVLHSKEATTPERMHRAGSKKNNRRSTGASTPDAIASVYLSPQQSYELPGDRQTFSAYDDVSFHHPAHPDAFASVYQSPIQPFDLPPDSKREEEDNARASPNTLSSTIPMTSLMNVARNLSLYDVVEDQVDNIRKEEDATTATISPVLLFGPVILPTTTRSSDDHSVAATRTTKTRTRPTTATIPTTSVDGKYSMEPVILTTATTTTTAIKSRRYEQESSNLAPVVLPKSRGTSRDESSSPVTATVAANPVVLPITKTKEDWYQSLGPAILPTRKCKSRDEAGEVDGPVILPTTRTKSADVKTASSSTADVVVGPVILPMKSNCRDEKAATATTFGPVILPMTSKSRDESSDDLVLGPVILPTRRISTSSSRDHDQAKARNDQAEGEESSSPNTLPLRTKRREESCSKTSDHAVILPSVTRSPGDEESSNPKRLVFDHDHEPPAATNFSRTILPTITKSYDEEESASPAESPPFKIMGTSVPQMPTILCSQDRIQNHVVPLPTTASDLCVAAKVTRRTEHEQSNNSSSQIPRDGMDCHDGASGSDLPAAAVGSTSTSSTTSRRQNVARRRKTKKVSQESEYEPEGFWGSLFFSMAPRQPRYF